MSTVERIRYCSLGIMDWYDWYGQFVGFSFYKEDAEKTSQE
jgi:hypothetical protein